MVPVYALMVLMPNSKLTRSLVLSPVLPVGLAVMYIGLLSQAIGSGLLEGIKGVFSTMQAPSYLPDMAAVAALFTNPVTTVLAWAHLLLLDFYQARSVLVDGIKASVPTGHSIALCFLFGPLGLLSHFATRALKAAFGPRTASSALS